MENTKSVQQENFENIERPKICCIDLDIKTINKLKSIFNNIAEGTLGDKIKLSYTSALRSRQLLLNCNFPPNLHEYDIVMVDLDNFSTIEYKYEDHTQVSLAEKASNYLLSSYPQTIFDPRPFGSYQLKIELNKISNRKHLLIIFSSNSYNIEYTPIEIASGSRSIKQLIIQNIYSLLDYPPLAESLFGKEIRICKIQDDFHSLLEKYFSKNASYKQTFIHRTTWINGEEGLSGYFVPLMVNLNGDIISYIETSVMST